MSFGAEAESPYPLTADEDEIPFFFEQIAPDEILIEGIHEEPWQGVAPGELEAIQSVLLNEPRLRGNIKGSALKIHLYGQSEVYVENEDAPLVSSANTKFTIQGNALHTNSIHSGVWRGAPRPVYLVE